MKKTIQITSGRGPVECCWVVAQVLKYFIEELNQQKIGYQVLHRELGPVNGTLQSATVQLQAKELEGVLKAWLGTIQWIGKSNFRKFHKRKNWFIGLYEIKAEQQLKLKTIDVSYQAIRSSGPGGQHANKVSSAIRATHIPTGLQVLATDSRSQYQNKKLAFKRLEQKVNHHNLEEITLIAQNQWENHLNLERCNPVRIFKGSDFKLKKKTEKNFKSKRLKLKQELKKQWEQ
jgi:peptide chain release factor